MSACTHVWQIQQDNKSEINPSVLLLKRVKRQSGRPEINVYIVVMVISL